MSYNRDMLLLRKENQARRLTAIDEVIHYFKCGGAERAFSYYNAFFKDDLDFATEQKLLKAIWTDDLALLENTCKDIIKTAWDTIREIHSRF